MGTTSLLIRNGIVVSASDRCRADVLIDGEVIAAVGRIDSSADRVIDAEGCYVIPGGIDTHTHLENPSLGVTRSADDFRSGTVAAAHGGTTTIIDFVKKESGATLLDSFLRRRERAETAIGVDLGLHPVVPATALADGSFDDLESLAIDHGATSWKFFMAYPGLLMVDDETLIHGFRRCADLGVLPMVHAENGHLVGDATQRLLAGGHSAEHYHHDAHSHLAEGEAVHRAVAIAASVGAPLFIVHVSSRFAAREIGRARADGHVVCGEACPQYLLAALEDYCDKGFEAAAYVCSPPIRERANQEYLWDAIRAGDLATVGTDHAAFTMCQPDDLPPQKPYGRAQFTKIPNGVPGIEERLRVMYEAGVVGGRFDICRFVDLVATRPAKLFGLHPRKGALLPGADADVVVWDPTARHTIYAADLHHRADYSLYEGMEVSAGPRWVIGRGTVLVGPDGAHIAPGRGRYLHRGRSTLSDELDRRSG